MSNQGMPFQRLDAYKVAKELARRVHEARIRDAELRDQAAGGEERVQFAPGPLPSKHHVDPRKEEVNLLPRDASDSLCEK